MKDRPVREDYRRWLNAQAVAASGNEDKDGEAEPVIAAPPEPPAALPYGGYVVWFHASLTYLDIRFDHNRFEIVTQKVSSASEAFYFDRLDDAYGHAADVGEPCLILFAEASGTPVRVAG